MFLQVRLTGCRHWFDSQTFEKRRHVVHTLNLLPLHGVRRLPAERLERLHQNRHNSRWFRGVYKRRKAWPARSHKGVAPRRAQARPSLSRVARGRRRWWLPGCSVRPLARRRQSCGLDGRPAARRAAATQNRAPRHGPRQGQAPPHDQTGVASYARRMWRASTSTFRTPPTMVSRRRTRSFAGR